ncbi:MAG: flavodoxin family protein [Deltaproteobacteria bacterium]|nr:MAG: flavodoxin family protein [Deltaproteobacteria bacterium]
MTDILPPQILCIYGSPRKGGNSDVLMDSFAGGVESAGGVAHRLYLRDMKLFPCREIHACAKSGECVLKDDLTPLFTKLMEVDAFTLSSPVMFYGVPAIAKAFIDRCQSLWARKYVLNMPVATGRLKNRKGVLLSLGGSNGKKLFDGVRLTFRYFLDTLDASPWGEILLRGVDEKGDIFKEEEGLANAAALGRQLVETLNTEIKEVAGGG